MTHAHMTMDQVLNCPYCMGPKKGGSMRGFGSYELFPGSGIMVPDAGELAAGATAGAIATGAGQLANSSGVKTAAQNAAASAIGTNIINFYKNNPVIAYGGTAAVVALLIYGGMSFLKK